jgi:hypothetical protein
MPGPEPPAQRPDPLFGEFHLGLNLPWLQYGCDFGANAWQPEGGLSQPARRRALDNALARVADSSVTCLRWFLLCDGRAGLAGHDATHGPRLDGRILADVDVALDALRRRGLRAIFVMFDFLWCARPRHERGVTLGGRRNLVFDRSRRARLIDGVVAPLVSHCAGHEAVLAWDLMNEPDWLARWHHPFAWQWAAPRDALVRALGEIVDAARAHAPQPVTIGVANHAGLGLVRGLGLDFYQVHWYDRFGLDAVFSQRVASLGLDRPLVLGEFPTHNTAVGPATIVCAARRLGYAGVYAWSLLADDEASSGVPPAIAGPSLPSS